MQKYEGATSAREVESAPKTKPKAVQEVQAHHLGEVRKSSRIHQKESTQGRKDWSRLFTGKQKVEIQVNKQGKSPFDEDDKKSSHARKLKDVSTTAESSSTPRRSLRISGVSRESAASLPKRTKASAKPVTEKQDKKPGVVKAKSKEQEQPAVDGARCSTATEISDDNNPTATGRDLAMTKTGVSPVKTVGPVQAVKLEECTEPVPADTLLDDADGQAECSSDSEEAVLTEAPDVLLPIAGSEWQKVVSAQYIQE